MRRVLLALLLATAIHAAEGDRKVLKANGVGCDTASLRAHLGSLYLGEQDRSLSFACVRLLGSEDPVSRHEAVLRLGALPAPPVEAIEKAAQSADPEVRRAAMRLRRESLARVRKDLLRAVLQTVAEDGNKGLAEELLGVAPLAAELDLDPPLAAALRATLEPSDLARLRAAAREGHEAARRAAVRALGMAPGAGGDEALPWLDAKSTRLRLAAALALGDRGDARCLAPLLDLLAADDVRVRRGAADALRAACRGGGVGYDPFAGVEGRARASEAWRKWIAARPADAPLHRPLPVGFRHIGRTLISVYSQNVIMEVDLEGNRTFEVKGVQGPWAVQGLPNGHRLIGLHTPQSLVEYDAEGNELSRIALPGRPQGFQRLDSGNTLVAIAEQSRVVEVAPDGSVPKEWTFEQPPVDVRLLENGNLLVCLMRPASVIELDREGRKVWSLGGLTHASTAQRLDNGNTLVAETGSTRVAEFDPEGNLVWEAGGFQMLYSAERLPDGSTLVADQAGVREIAPDGTPRWLQRTTSFARATRY